MAGFYTVIASTRTTDPDLPSLLQTLRGIDPTIGIRSARVIDPQQPGVFLYQLKKAPPDWTPAQITQATTVINAAATASADLTAQAAIDTLPLIEKAILLTLLDQINVLRTAASLPTVTVQQAIAAVRAKAGTL